VVGQEKVVAGPTGDLLFGFRASDLVVGRLRDAARDVATVDEVVVACGRIAGALRLFGNLRKFPARLDRIGGRGRASGDGECGGKELHGADANTRTGRRNVQVSTPASTAG